MPLKRKLEQENINNNKKMKIETERDLFIDPIRAQTPTGKGKPDTYYAMYKGQSVFVKGPYKNRKYAKIQVYCDELKCLLNKSIKESDYLIANNNSRIIKIKPDIDFLEGRDKSIHNNYIDSQLYVLMNDLCNYKECIVEKKTSRTFGTLEVLDNSSSHCRTVCLKDFINRQTALGVFMALFFRYIFEINDTCRRNIMVDEKTKKVYTVDENNYFTGKRSGLFKSNVQKDWVEPVKESFNKYRQDLQTILQLWKQTIQSNSFIDYCKKIKIDTNIVLTNIDFLINIKNVEPLLFNKK